MRESDMTKGMPPPKGSGRYDWVSAMEAMEQAIGEPVLTAEFTDMDNVNSARNSAMSGEIRALRKAGHHVVANIRSSYIDEATNTRRGDLWLTLVPDEED